MTHGQENTLGRHVPDHSRREVRLASSPPHHVLEHDSGDRRSKNQKPHRWGGGDSTLVDHLLDPDFDRITVLDISASALERAKARLGDLADFVTWIEADITDFRSSKTFDVWHDRAMFNFLTEAEDREKYCETMNRAVSAQGHVIISTFGYEAPPTCSGLPVMRYSPEFLTLAIGSNFEIVESFEELHHTPGGTKQPFIFCRFTRRKH